MRRRLFTFFSAVLLCVAVCGVWVAEAAVPGFAWHLRWGPQDGGMVEVRGPLFPGEQRGSLVLTVAPPWDHRPLSRAWAGRVHAGGRVYVETLVETVPDPSPYWPAVTPIDVKLLAARVLRQKAKMEDIVIDADGTARMRLPAQRPAAVWQVVVPYWMPAAALALVAARPLLRWSRATGHSSSSLCPHCDYDLRASPDRCPECGMAIRSEKPPTVPQ